jgi:hypothetical protein
VTDKIERWSSFFWPFVVVGRRNGGWFLLTVARRAERIVVLVEVVVVVGFFTASTAHLHLGCDQIIPNPPLKTG